MINIAELLQTTGDTLDCYEVCKCEDLYPFNKLWASCAILLAVGGVQRCVNRREWDAGILTINSSEIVTVSFAPRSDWPSCGIQVIVDGAVECLKNRDEIEELDLTIDYSTLPDDIVLESDLVKREDLALSLIGDSSGTTLRDDQDHLTRSH